MISGLLTTLTGAARRSRNPAALEGEVALRKPEHADFATATSTSEKTS
jgi:hypothetical protein